MKEEFFDYLSFRKERALSFGFTADGDAIKKSFSLLGDAFTLFLTVDLKTKEVKTTLWDNFSEEEYVLHKVKDAQGGFVASVRLAYEEILESVADNCCEREGFSSEFARKLIVYVRETYGDELEFLWKKFPHDAVWRHKETGKWYGALLTAKEKSLAFDVRSTEEGEREVLDVKCDPARVKDVVDGKTVLNGYHMNKKSWITVLLDGSVPFERVTELLDESYRLK